MVDKKRIETDKQHKVQIYMVGRIVEIVFHVFVEAPVVEKLLILEKLHQTYYLLSLYIMSLKMTT